MCKKSPVNTIIAATDWGKAMRALLLICAMPVASALELSWPASPMQRQFSGTVRAVEVKPSEALLTLDDLRLRLAALPGFVDVRDLRGCDFTGQRGQSPAGAGFAAWFQCQGRQYAFGVNLPPDRILKTSLSLRAVEGQVRVQSGERVLLTLQSGQSGSVRVDGQLWCVHATFEAARQTPGIAAERVDRLSWALMPTSTARLCRK